MHLSFDRGAEFIKRELTNMTSHAGVYLMKNDTGDILYVGKAKSLKNRLASYTRPQGLSIRIQRMVAQVKILDIIPTQSEGEALLLECNLIKEHLPKYNVLLKDNKSFPYIWLDTEHDFARLTKFRGKKNKGQYFGPYPSSFAVSQTLKYLERAFLLRSCNNHVFNNRQRPCLLYQIGRCSAPCTGLINKSAYNELVQNCLDFLHGKNRNLQHVLTQKMQSHAKSLEFEQAAIMRNRIHALNLIQSEQKLQIQGTIETADIITSQVINNQGILAVMMIRNGQNLGLHHYDFTLDEDKNLPELHTTLVGQFYTRNTIPPLILSNLSLENISQALQDLSTYKIQILTPQRGDKKSLINSCLFSAKNILERKIQNQEQNQNILDELQELLSWPQSLDRIEVYDNSHLSGTDQLGVMITAEKGQLNPKAYRRFNIRNPKIQGNDYAMMHEVLSRRLQGSLSEQEDLPNLIILDGGYHHLQYVLKNLSSELTQNIAWLAIAKGEKRNDGLETLYLPEGKILELNPQSKIKHFLQNLRDEAHRFAITGQRKKREKNMRKSPLDEIIGIGAQKKKDLLTHFGSITAIKSASISELQQVKGISENLAQNIKNHLS